MVEWQSGQLIAVCPSTAAGTVETEDNTEPVLSPPFDLSGHFTAKDIDAVRFQATKGDTWIIDVFAHSVGSTADPLLIVERVVAGADGKKPISDSRWKTIIDRTRVEMICLP